MANRRMFSKTITNSSKFLMLPPTAQNLYFHLGMNADDDGFCEHFAIMRMVEAKPDDLRILQARGFVEIFDDKVLVILDWKENNYIRSDRYTPSRYLAIYKQELEAISLGIPTVYQRLTQVRLGKDRIGEERGGGRRTPTPKKFSSRKSITHEVISDIAKKYKVAVVAVEDCWDTAQNWLDSKGTTKKNYRSFLANWVKRDIADGKIKVIKSWEERVREENPEIEFVGSKK